MRTTRKIIVSALCFALGMIVGGYLCKPHDIAHPELIAICDTSLSADTLRYILPDIANEKSVGALTYRLPVGKKDIHTTAPSCPLDTGQTVETSSHARDQELLGTGAGGIPRLCGDSVIIELPVVQRHYSDSTYEAWISGPVAPRLDSIYVFPRNKVITIREYKPPDRWHIGITAGYAATPKGFQPYLGIGITYSIISF